MDKSSCPIHQPLTHCSTCTFSREGKCAHSQILKEKADYAAKLRQRDTENSRDQLN